MRARQDWGEAERLAKARIDADRGDTLQLVDGTRHWPGSS